MWLEHLDFKQALKVWWEEDQITGWEGYKFMNRLKGLKTKIKCWSKTVFGDILLAKREAEARLMVLDREEGREGLDSELRNERAGLQHLLGELVHKEEVKWRQSGKVRWAREGDGNTKYFHRVATGFQKRNFIDRLQTEDGRLPENVSDLEEKVINFFKKLYSSEEEVGWGLDGLNWCPISSSREAWIERPFEEEICAAVFDCGKDRSPRADGFSLFFFQSSWDIVKGDLMKAMADFYNSGIINAVANETLICLIPKKKDAVKLKDFRPISLVTSLYKVVSKVLASRLRELLGETIYPT